MRSCSEDGQEAIKDVCDALDVALKMLKQLTDRTQAQKSKAGSIALPQDNKSFAFVPADSPQVDYNRYTIILPSTT